MIIDLYVGYKEACCYGVEKVENSTIIVMESEVWYFIRNQQIGIDRALWARDTSCPKGKKV